MTTTAAVAMDEETVNRLRNAVMRIGRRLRTTAARRGPHATQSGVLATLVREGPMRAGDLAEAEAINPTLLSRVLGHLEEAGLVDARRGPRGRPLHPRLAHRAGAAAARAPARPARRAPGGRPGGPARPIAWRPCATALPALEDAGAEEERPMIARAGRTDTFAALSTPNYRRYFAGQAVSLVGTWMQTVAQGWLVLELTGSGTALGLVAAAQFLPILAAGALRRAAGGPARQAAPADRHPGRPRDHGPGARRCWCHRRGPALDGGGLALLLGLVTACDNPVRQSFVQEMVGPGELRNAVSLNSVLVNTARAVGPGRWPAS